jgi:hypothetical protein
MEWQGCGVVVKRGPSESQHPNDDDENKKDDSLLAGAQP